MKYPAVTTCQKKDIVYKTKKRFAEDDHEICCIRDQPHMVKTTCNNLAYSSFDNAVTRLLWNDNYYLTWSHIRNFMLDDLEVEVQLRSKITTDCINVTPFSVMDASSVSSKSVNVALKEDRKPERVGIAKY